MRFSSRWLAWLCLSLMLWTAVAESTHNHPNQTESRFLLDLRGGPHDQPHRSSNHIRPVFAAVGLLQEEAVIAKARLECF